MELMTAILFLGVTVRNSPCSSFAECYAVKLGSFIQRIRPGPRLFRSFRNIFLQ
jgi:hypothetical protein